MGIHPVQTSEPVTDHGIENLRDFLIIFKPYFQMHILSSVEFQVKCAGRI